MEKSSNGTVASNTTDPTNRPSSANKTIDSGNSIYLKQDLYDEDDHCLSLAKLARYASPFNGYSFDGHHSSPLPRRKQVCVTFITLARTLFFCCCFSKIKRYWIDVNHQLFLYPKARPRRRSGDSSTTTTPPSMVIDPPFKPFMLTPSPIQDAPEDLSVKKSPVSVRTFCLIFYELFN